MAVDARRRGLAFIARGAWFLLFSATGCHGDKGKIILNPPFDAKAKIGEVTATWQTSAEERAFAEGRSA